MPRQLILLTGKYLTSKAVTFPDESIITKVSFHVDSVIKLNIRPKLGFILSLDKGGHQPRVPG